MKGEVGKTRVTRDKSGVACLCQGVKFIAQLKGIYTSKGNKQEELKAIVQQESCDVVAIREMKWDEAFKWHAAIHGYKHF